MTRSDPAAAGPVPDWSSKCHDTTRPRPPADYAPLGGDDVLANASHYARWHRSYRRYWATEIARRERSYLTGPVPCRR